MKTTREYLSGWPSWLPKATPWVSAGKAISHQALNRALVRIARKAGVRAPNELSAHGLRRTFAEHAYEAGFSFEELASSLGNSPPVVKRFYVQAAVSPAARRINAFINRDRGDGRSNA